MLIRNHKWFLPLNKTSQSICYKPKQDIVYSACNIRALFKGSITKQFADIY